MSDQSPVMTPPLAPTPEEQQTARAIAEKWTVPHYPHCAIRDFNVQKCNCPHATDVTLLTSLIVEALAAARATDQQRIKELTEVARSIRRDLESERTRRVAAQEAITLVHVPRIAALEQALRDIGNIHGGTHTDVFDAIDAIYQVAEKALTHV